MIIGKKQIFGVMFSGIPGLGIDLSKSYSEFSDKKSGLDAIVKNEGDLQKGIQERSFLDVEFPETYQATILDIAKGIFKHKNRDCSFIHSSAGDIEDFVERWNSSYVPVFGRYKKMTDEIFALLKDKSVFKDVSNIRNMLEYKETIQQVIGLQWRLYGKEMQSMEFRQQKKDFDDRFSLFNNNIPYQASLEKNPTDIDLFFRSSKYPICAVDVCSRRIKRAERIAEKVARKWIMLIDKIETYRKTTRGYPKIVYDDLFITDIFGFLMLQARGQKLDEGIVSRGSIRTVEDSDINPKHKNKGQRQIKLIDSAAGILYDVHIFRSPNDWVDNEFTRKDMNRKSEFVPHEIYVDEKLRSVLKRNPLYREIYKEVYERSLGVLKMCPAEPITQSFYNKYSGLCPDERFNMIDEGKRNFGIKLNSFRYASRGAKGIGLGLPTIKADLDELLKCHYDEIMKRFGYNLEEVCNFEGDNCINNETLDIVNSTKGLLSKFKEVTRQDYKTCYFEDILSSYSTLVWICDLNKDMRKSYYGIKKEGINDDDILECIKFYRETLDHFSKKYVGNTRIHAQTKFNIYKYLINSHKVLLNINPNRSGGSYFNAAFKISREFIGFVEENDSMLSSRQLSEVDDINVDHITKLSIY